MSFLKEIKSWIGLDPDSVTRPDEVGRNNPLFVYIKIPADIQPLERGDLFEDPLQAALDKEGVGTITGGGSLLSDPDQNGARRIEYCGIDVDLYNAVKGLTLLRRELMRLHAPANTVLLYELDGTDVEEPVYRMEN